MRIIGFETLRSGRILVLMRLRWLCGLVDEILVVFGTEEDEGSMLGEWEFTFWFLPSAMVNGREKLV